MVTNPDEESLAILDRGAAELWRNGVLVGHLTSALERGWGLARPLGTQTFVWFLVTLVNGDRYIIEDYPPYATLPDALLGRLKPEQSADGDFDVRWLTGEARARAWTEYGIHESFGSYRFEGTQVQEWWWSRFLDRLKGRS